MALIEQERKTKTDAWNADEIRNNAQSWSLHGDAKLLEFMQNISKASNSFNRMQISKF